MKILYIHGLSSSGNSETAATLRRLLPDDTIISPDLPIEPMEALELLKRIVKEEKIDLAIGTSMGGMFAQKLRGTPKFLINPSFHVSQSMRQRLGINKFFSERQDGISEYEITPELCDRYEELERTQFDELSSITERFYNTRAFFGSEDDVVNCCEEYYKYYGQLTIFPGGHRLTEEIIRKYLLRHIERHRRWMTRKIRWQNETERLFRETASDSESINLLNHERFQELNKNDTFTLRQLIQKCDKWGAFMGYAPIDEPEIMLRNVRHFLSKYQGKQCSLLISVRYGCDYESYESFCEEKFKGSHADWIKTTICVELNMNADFYTISWREDSLSLSSSEFELFVIVGENKDVNVEKW